METICKECGTTMVSIPPSRADLVREGFGQASLSYFELIRDHAPTCIRITLKQTNTSYILSPETEAVLRSQPFSRIRSIDEGKDRYEVIVSLQKDGALFDALQSDPNIEHWETTQDVGVCDEHRSFNKYTFKSKWGAR